MEYAPGLQGGEQHCFIRQNQFVNMVLSTAEVTGCGAFAFYCVQPAAPAGADREEILLRPDGMYRQQSIHAAQLLNQSGIPGGYRLQSDRNIRIAGRAVTEIIRDESVFQIMTAGFIAVILIAVTPSIQNA